MDHRWYWVWMQEIAQIGPKTIHTLLEIFKSPKEIFLTSSEEILKISQLTKTQKENIIRSRNSFSIEKYEHWIEKWGIELCTIEDMDYPPLLKNIYDPPLVLYKKGKSYDPAVVCIAIVGSRNCTTYGKKMAYDLAKDLTAYGITIISGFARGIDTYVHQGTLAGGGNTVAVLGCGLECCYPPENKYLKNQIEEKGMILSEYPIGARPLAHHFPQRNRIISGMSAGVIVVEAAEKSGSLITADLALNQGREVFSVPGNATSRNSRGCNQLIKQGCSVVTCAEDVIETLSFSYKGLIKKENNNKNLKITLEGSEKRIYDCILDEPTHIEMILVQSKMIIQEVQSILTILELKGIIKQLPSKYFIRT